MQYLSMGSLRRRTVSRDLQRCSTVNNSSNNSKSHHELNCAFIQNTSVSMAMRAFLLGCFITCGVTDVPSSTSLSMMQSTGSSGQSSAKFPPANIPKIILERTRNQLRMQMEGAVPKLITVQVDQTVYFHCFVENLGDKMVSWIRLKDMHLLTVMKDTYTYDDRFQAIHDEYTSNWMLQIKYVQSKDEGLYECQVNSNPPKSHYYRLKVLVPKAKILEGPELYYHVDASVNLTCLITGISELPTFVFWYFGDKVINYSPTRFRTSIEKHGSDSIVSRLFLKGAQPSDSGNYTCDPSSTDPAIVTIHVMKGEMRSAVLNDAATAQISVGVVPNAWPVLLLLSLLIVRLLWHR